MAPCKIWIEQCDAAQKTEDEFEKFLKFLEAAENDAEFQAEIPAFVAEIKTIFEKWQLSEYLEIVRQSEPFDATLYTDEDDDPELERKLEISRPANDLLLVERARQWLLEDD